MPVSVGGIKAVSRLEGHVAIIGIGASSSLRSKSVIKMAITGRSYIRGLVKVGGIQATSHVNSKPVVTKPRSYTWGLTYIRQKAVWLVDPHGNEIRCDDAAFSWSINRGVQWGAKLDPRYVITGWGGNDEWLMFARCPEGPWKSMPLSAPKLANEIAVRQGFRNTILGTDMASWNLDTEGISSPIYTDTSTVSIMNGIETISGVTIINPPIVQIEDYTIAGATMLRHLEDVLTPLGYSYITNNQGQIQCFPSNYSYNSERTFYNASIRAEVDWSAMYTNLRFIKRSKFTDRVPVTYTQGGVTNGQALPNWDASTIQARDFPTIGHIAYVACYDKFNNCCKLITLDPSFSGPLIPQETSTNPAVKFGYEAVGAVTGTLLTGFTNQPPFGQLVLMGKPVGLSNFDFKFRVDYPNDLFFGDGLLQNVSGIRTKIKSISSTLWPNLAFMPGLVPIIWQDVQKNVLTVRATLSCFDPFLQPVDTIPVQGVMVNGAVINFPTARIENTSWRVSTNGSQQTIAGYVAIPPPSGAQLVIVEQPS